MRYPLRIAGVIGIALLFGLTGCKDKQADIILINGIIHTVDDSSRVVQACAIKNGRIAAVGRTEDLLFDYAADTVIDLRGKAVYPGLIDAHCHYYGYAMTLNQVALGATTSWEEVVTVVDSFGRDFTGEWIIGRGWDQNDWPDKDFPTNRILNEKFPDRPVLLHRVDGHAAIANAKALELAGIDQNTPVEGGRIVRDYRGLTGVLVDNAVTLVENSVPTPSTDEVIDALKRAEQDLFAVGLTTVDDAGLDLRIINIIDSLQQAGELRIRVYAMAAPTEENLERFLNSGPYKTDRLHVSSFKIYADGALGSRGACMLKPYKDEPRQYGFLLEDIPWYQEMALRLYDAGFQMNTHCIGDSANRLFLDIYGSLLGGENDRRWRIEHAQVVHPDDLAKYGDYSVIPSVQPAHATSDMYWAEDRIGKERLQGAYAYKSLLAQNGMLAYGSDFPVENINPMLGFYAAVARVDLTDWPYGGFMKEEALGRDSVLKAMTTWAAHANFEEDEKGSLEPGKVADLVIFPEDLFSLDEKQLPYAQVWLTMVDGEVVYSAEN
ncbi:MAG: amidohydrolase family protein [Bacteroidota bacterium]